MGITGADGIMLDLGVSSYQFDNGERGFSYNTDAPLDMRMDTRKDLTAAVIVNEYPEEEIRRILRDYGEEKFAHQIASNIVKERSKGRIETTFELNEIIKNSIPAKFRANGHPSRQTFQALRIACNEELDVLETSLDDMADFLNPGGRLSIITFHSLEDRIVKNAFKRFENPCICPPNFPKCVCGRVSKGNVITRKPIIPTDGEIEDNPRSRSAKLRVFERTL
jgi:16S rRNA (cytosine1402-N4)-methyltransferase